MGYIAKNWHGVKNCMNLSQKFLDKLKPETALKNRINDAGNKMECQILRLEQAHNKLKKSHEHVFKKIVEAKLTRNESKARTYAIELQEIRKIKNKIANAKLTMEQIKLRLSTVSELGDIVVTLSPCMSLIKGLTPAISNIMPNLNTSMQDLSNMLGDMISNSSLSTEPIFTSEQNSEDTTAILNEAHNILEGKTKHSIPEPPITPVTPTKNLTKESEFII